MTSLPQRTLGNLSVSAIGLGAMPMSMHGRDVSEQQAMATIHAALDNGITLIDTADGYTASGDMGENERLVARALATYAGDTTNVLVATKGGHTRSGADWGINGSASYLMEACDASLKALGVEAIGLYQHHRPDPSVDYAESLGALKTLHDAGKIRMAGISNASIEQIKQAQEILGDAFVSVQNQFSPSFRSSEAELEYCASQGIAFLPWSPLGGVGSTDKLGDAYASVAQAHGVTPQQVCLAWHLAKAPVVIPIPGSSRPESIADSAAAANLTLTADELASLD